MKQITFFLDFISPYAYLAFEHLPQALQGLSYSVDYRPVLFAGLLKHHGQLGPAEIEPKRDWTYRQVLWLAHRHGIPMQMPAVHPFNPLPLLRLALACGAQRAGQPLCLRDGVSPCVARRRGRGRCAAARGPGRDRCSPRAIRPATPSSRELKANTEGAIARGLFGVPTCAVDDKLFWGFDALPMLRAYLEGDAWFAGGAWEAAARVGQGISRAKPG